MIKKVYILLSLICLTTFLYSADNVYLIETQHGDVYINSNGKIVNNNIDESDKTKPELELYTKYTYISDFKDGYAYALKRITDDYKVPYIENGEVIEGAEEVISGIYGGIIDTKGNEIISFTLGEYTEVSDKCVKCKERYTDKNGNRYSLYGYKNLQNEWILYPQFQYADNFRFGYAEVSLTGDDYYLINKKGKILLKDDYQFIYVLSKNKLIVSKDNTNFYICNLKGKKISANFNLIKIIDSNMCLAQMEDEKFYINNKSHFFFFKDYN